MNRSSNLEIFLGKLRYLSVLACLCLGTSCQTASKNFVEKDEKTVLHTPTGIQYPKQIMGWEQVDTQVLENITPEILAELIYTQKASGQEFNPKVSVFFMKGQTTANLQVIENKESLNFLGAEKVKSDLNSGIPKKQGLVMSSYRHLLRQTVSTVGATTEKEIPLQSLFIQSRRKPQLVFLMTTAEKRPSDQGSVLKLMEDFLSKN